MTLVLTSLPLTLVGGSLYANLEVMHKATDCCWVLAGVCKH